MWIGALLCGQRNRRSGIANTTEIHLLRQVQMAERNISCLRRKAFDGDGLLASNEDRSFTFAFLSAGDVQMPGDDAGRTHHYGRARLPRLPVKSCNTARDRFVSTSRRQIAEPEKRHRQDCSIAGAHKKPVDVEAIG